MVPGGDIAALARAIDNSRGLDRADCVQLARDRYSLDRMVANYETAFERILQPARPVEPLPTSRSLINLLDLPESGESSSLATV